MSTPAKMSAEQRSVRDAEIRALAAAGTPRSEIAARFEVTDRQVRRIVNASQSRPPSAVPDLEVPDVIEIDPFRELGHVVGVHREAIARLRTLAARSPNEAVAAGASKAAAATARDLLAVLTSAGLTPVDTFSWRGELELERAFRVLNDVAREAGLDADAIIAAFESRFRWRSAELHGLPPAPDLELVA